MKLEVSSASVEIRGRRILQDFSMTLDGGELVGLIGPNGAGKSTLLKTVIGAGRGARGSFALNDVPLEGLSALERARAMAYLPQERHVEWRLPARAVVMLGRFPHRRGFGPPAPGCEAAVDRALSAVDADALAARSVTTLSGGERARVLLARALAVEAPLLLVDEPTAGLDPYHQLGVLEILRDLARQGTGVLAVLHDLDLAAHFADRLILMHHGTLVAEGKPADVLQPANLEEVYRVTLLNHTSPREAFRLPWRRIHPPDPPGGNPP